MPDGTREEEKGDGVSAVNLPASALGPSSLAGGPVGLGGGALLPREVKGREWISSVGSFPVPDGPSICLHSAT